jgi:hypothetical protein
MPCPHCFAPDHTAATCPLFAHATAAVTAEQSRQSPEEHLEALIRALPTTGTPPALLAVIREIQRQLSDLRREIAEVRVSLDMEGI